MMQFGLKRGLYGAGWSEEDGDSLSLPIGR